MMKKLTIKDIKKQVIWEMALLWISGVLFLLYFSYMTSPLFPYSYGWDSAFFQLVGNGMTKGYLPYRDFYDMKGPWLFFIEYAAQLLWRGRTGIFLLQCVSLCCVLFLCSRIYRRYFGGSGILKSLITVLPLYVALASTIEGGNLTEEWSLPFIFLSVYLSLDFIMGEKKTHRPVFGFVYGVCFGVIALIRITNAVMICAIVLTISCYLIKNKEWKNLLWNAAAFLLGLAAAFLIPALYFGYYGELGDMLQCVFVFGYIYGTEGFRIGAGGIFLVTLLLPLMVFVLTGEDNMKLWMLVLWNTAGMMVTLGMGNSTLHDYMMVIPGMMFGVWSLAKKWQDTRAGQGNGIDKKRGYLAAAAVIVCFAYPCYKMAGAGVSILKQAGDDTAYRNVMETAECIPEAEQNSVWGYEIALRWYTIADIIPYHRYCGWQEHYMTLSPQIAAEVGEMLETAPPKWIVTKKSAMIENETVKDKMAEDYALYMENEEYKLYQHH
ncbi:MAG: glycosyltransferase family 39 protein [Bacillus sp. (in: Bacteria)]|nr:glycosyltransferase family 39 protein [Bacillus sp. (in: firmicutes)]MCM1427153.1 glycosyltransferase family 39 protein [Eubacterium sp.]